jgi:hypothetical protein
VKALQEGQYIKHFQYGFGVVIESDSERTSIDFDQHGLKKFVTTLMAVEPAGEAPPRPARARRRKSTRAKASPSKATPSLTK